MRMIVAALMAVMIVGCGEDDSDSKDSGGSKLVGTWIYSPAGANSGIFMDLKKDGTYQTSWIVISGNSVQSENDFGTYSTTDSEISFTPERSSCAEVNHDTLQYSFVSDNLQMTVDATTFIFAPEDEAETQAADTSGMTVTTGCFDTDGNFEARAIQDL